MVEYIDWSDMDDLCDSVSEETIEQAQALTKGNPCILLGFHKESGCSGDRAVALWLEKNEPEKVVTEWYEDGFGKGCNLFYYDEAFADKNYDVEANADDIISEIGYLAMQDGTLNGVDDLLIEEAWKEFTDEHGCPFDDGSTFEKFKNFMLEFANIGAFDIDYRESDLLKHLGWDRKEVETWGAVKNNS